VGIFNAPGTNMSSIDKVKVVPYASAVGSLQHAQVCTRSDFAFVTGFYLADSRRILEWNTEIDKESLALFARNERPHDDI